MSSCQHGLHHQMHISRVTAEPDAPRASLKCFLIMSTFSTQQVAVSDEFLMWMDYSKFPLKTTVSHFNAVGMYLLETPATQCGDERAVVWTVMHLGKPCPFVATVSFDLQNIQLPSAIQTNRRNVVTWRVWEISTEEFLRTNRSGRLLECYSMPAETWGRTSKLVLFTKNCYDGQINDDEISGSCSRLGGEKKRIQNSVGKIWGENTTWEGWE